MNKLYYLIFSIFLFSLSVDAQIGVKFDNGITVAIMSQTTPSASKDILLKKYKESLFYTPTDLSSIKRSFYNNEEKVSFNYNIEIVAISESKTFKVTIKSASNMQINDGKNDTKDYKTMTLPDYPTDIIVNDGDTIVLDILENPTTKAKIQDLIKITRENKPFNNYFSEVEEARDFSMSDVELQLADYKVYINGKLIKRPGIDSARTRFLGMEFNKYGLLVLSPLPEKEYPFQKLGVIDENKLTFTYNGDKFEIISAVPILGLGKKWNLWVANFPRIHKDYQIPDVIGFTTFSNKKMSDFFPDTADKNVKESFVFRSADEKP